MIHRHLSTSLALILAATASPRSAHAEEPTPDPDQPLTDLPRYEAPVPDLTPAMLPTFAPPLLGTAAFSVLVSARLSEERHDFGGSLVLELPFDGFVSRKAKRGTIRKNIDDDSSDSSNPSSDAEHEGDSSDALPPPKARPEEPRAILPMVRPKDARAAVAASRRVRRTEATREELDSMASRARYGSILPTLRLRATRLVDESSSLSPTSYDADRTTSRGGASLWLEGRATWNLDRLVFASEEVRVTQLHLSYSAAQEKASNKVVTQLFAWQRAVFATHDPTLSIGACVQAWLSVQEISASLDLLTGGWFEKWSRGKAGPTPDCVEAFQRG